MQSKQTALSQKTVIKCLQQFDESIENHLFDDRSDILSLLADSLPVLISYLDKNMRYQFNNAEYERWYGVDRQEIKGKHISDVVGKDVYKTIKHDLERGLSGFKVSYDRRMTYENGEIKDIKAIYTPDISRQGEVLGLFVLVTDISESTQIGEKLQASEKQYRTLVDTVPSGIAEIDACGSIVFVNPTLSSMLDYDEGELLQKTICDLVITEHDKIKVSKIFSNEPVKTASPYFLACKTKYGRIVDVQIDWNYKNNSRGECLGVIAVITNVTERKRANEKLRKQRRALDNAAQKSALDEMASGIAHELNQPLAIISSYAQESSNKLQPYRAELKSVIEYLNRIEKQANRAGKLLHRICELYNERQTKMRYVNLKSAIKNVVKLAKEDISQDISIRIESKQNIPLLLLDKLQIEQALFNVVRNAMDAALLVKETRVPKVEVVLKFVKNFIVIDVHDNGCGIEAHHVDSIFQSFMTTKKTGMGMGLAISHSIVEANGGELKLLMTSEHGSIFQFKFNL